MCYVTTCQWSETRAPGASRSSSAPSMIDAVRERSTKPDQSAADSRSRRTNPARSDFEAGPLLRLQRLAGNAAASRLISRKVIEGDLIVTGNTIVEGSQHVAGDSDVGGTSMVGNDQAVGGNQDVDGNASVGGEHDVAGSASVGGEHEVASNATVGGDHQVAGNAEVAGNATTAGSQTIEGDLSVQGQLHNEELQQTTEVAWAASNR